MANYTPLTVRTISVDVQKNGGAADGTEPWTVYAAGDFDETDFTEAGTGDATLTGPVYDTREYRIVFDPIAGYVTPTAANIVASATPQTFVGNYVDALANSITIAFVNKPVNSKWWLHSTGGGLVAEGTDDQVLVDQPEDTYWVVWGWAEESWPPYTYDATQEAALTAIGVTAPEAPGPNAPRSSPEQVLAAGGDLSFIGTYTPRSLLAKSQMTHGNSISSDRYWEGSDILSNGMRGRSSDLGWFTVGWPVPSDLPVSTFIRMSSPVSGVQTFWLFWKGSGTIVIEGNTYVCGAGAGQPGGGGHQFTHDVQHDLQPADTGDWVTVDITATAAAPGQLSDVEIIHESYCGNGTTSAHRSLHPVTGHMITDQAKKLARHMHIARFLSHHDDTVDPDPITEGAWVGNDYVLDWEGTGRTASSQAFEMAFEVGQAYQDQIDIANAMDCDIWITWNTYDNPAFTTMLIDMLEADYYDEPDTSPTGASGLRPGLRVWFEWSNETWNSSFFCDPYARYWGLKYAGSTVDHNGDAFSPPNTEFAPALGGTPKQGFADLANGGGLDSGMIIPGYRYQAYRAWEIQQEYKAALIAKHGAGYNLDLRLRAVVAGQGSNSYYGPTYLRELQPDGEPGRDGIEALVSFDPANPTVPARDDFYAWSVASYTADDLNPGGAILGNRSVWEAEMYNTIATWMANFQGLDKAWWAEQKIVANDYGLDFVAYEGGEHIFNAAATPGSDLGDWYAYSEVHPAMYSAYREMLDSAKTIGFSDLVHYLTPRTYIHESGHGRFGLRETNNDDELTSYKWQAWVDWQHLNVKP